MLGILADSFRIATRTHSEEKSLKHNSYRNLEAVQNEEDRKLRRNLALAKRFYF